MNQPNKPCECGSGRKQKKCHPFGAPAFGPEPEPKPTRKMSPASAGGFAAILCLMAASGYSERFERAEKSLR